MKPLLKTPALAPAYALNVSNQSNFTTNLLKSHQFFSKYP